MLICPSSQPDFSRGCAGKRIGPLLFATHPHHGLPYIYVGFLTHKLLKCFTGRAICGMNRGNRCSYSSFPLSHLLPRYGHRL
jgi:hypothetical protein